MWVRIMGGRRAVRGLARAAAVAVTAGVFALAAPGVAGAAQGEGAARGGPAWAAQAARFAPPGGCAGRKVRTLTFATGSVLVFRRPGGYVCALTQARNPGGSQQIAVSVQARGNAPVRRARLHPRTSQAVTVHAGHRCVSVRGSVGKSSVSSGWILC